MFVHSLAAAAVSCAFAGIAAATVTPSTIVPPSARAGAVPTANGTGLNAQIWRSSASTILSSRQLIASTAPEARFISMKVNYGPADVWTPLNTFLGTDAPSLQTINGGSVNGSTMAKSLLFRFQGFIAIRNAGTFDFSVASDDGMELKIGGQTITSFDGDRGFATSTGRANFAQSGLYAIELIYWGNSQGSSGVQLGSSFCNGIIQKADLYNIPAPTAASMLAAGGLLAARRRRTLA
ncbi:MAG: hypothetical protein K2Q20_09830 [Phycisphaerales bacterium]|nr:hypothetical protein [Phycisphaerales bacterium]